MKKINTFFDKFNSQAIKEIKKREIVCEILKKITDQEIPFENISFSNRIIKIKGSSGLKSQILIKKNTIMKALAGRLKDTKIEDIQ